MNEQDKNERAAHEATSEATHETRSETSDDVKVETLDNRVVEDADEANIVLSDEDVRRVMNRRSRRSFLALGVAALGAYGGWRWIKTGTDAEGIPYQLRQAHEFNQGISQALFRSQLAPEFPREMAREPRVNGGEGLSEGFDPQAWRLQVVGLANPRSFPQYRENIAYQTANDNMNAGDASTAQLESEGDGKNGKSNDDAKRSDDAEDDFADGGQSAEDVAESGLLLTLDDIRNLPRTEMTTELKCIEGWSAIVNWAGARFSDFADEFKPATINDNSSDSRSSLAKNLVRYVSMETPDGGYYVGFDMESAMHPQTLLCYEMNGQPLTLEHGAPLRLVTATKYGIKSIKRIGRIEFTDEQPDDFWAERGYDWYSGH